MKKAHDFPVMSYLMVCKDGVVGESLGIAVVQSNAVILFLRPLRCLTFYTIFITIMLIPFLPNFH